MKLDEALRIVTWKLGSPAPSLDEQVAIVNDTGEWFSGAHQWNYLDRGPVPINARATISLTAATWTPASLALSQTGAFAGYTHVPGDMVQVTSGTGITIGYVEVAGKQSNNAIILVSSIGTSSASDVAATMTNQWCALPTDLIHFLPGFPTQAPNSGFALRPADLGEIALARVGPTVSTNYAYLWAASWARRYDITVNPPVQGGPNVLRMEIWPEIAAGYNGAFMCCYRAKWLPVTTDSVSLDIPDHVRPAFKEALRCFAGGYEEDDEATLSQRCMQLVQGPVWAQAVNQDSYVQPNLGGMRGSAVLEASGYGGALTQFTIADPT